MHNSNKSDLFKDNTCTVICINSLYIHCTGNKEFVSSAYQEITCHIFQYATHSFLISQMNAAFTTSLLFILMQHYYNVLVSGTKHMEVIKMFTQQNNMCYFNCEIAIC